MDTGPFLGIIQAYDVVLVCVRLVSSLHEGGDWARPEDLGSKAWGRQSHDGLPCLQVPCVKSFRARI